MEIKTVGTCDGKEFERQINLLLQDGYKILSTNCGFLNTEKYDFCGSWQAILLFEPKQETDISKIDKEHGYFYNWTELVTNT